MSVIKRVKVRVPATTSNLGPGFDCLGLALDLYNELILEMHAEPGEAVVEIKGEGKNTLPRDRTNLIVKAADKILAGRIKNRLVFKAVNRIPTARGLGSSAAAIVAGLYAANRLIKPAGLSQEQIFQHAVELEGHPDNVAPAIFGGLVVSFAKNGGAAGPATCVLKPHKDLRAVVCIPNFELPTSQSREVVPHTLLRSEAVANIARASLLVAALEKGRWEILADAMEDRLHQPYRRALIPGFDEVLQAAQGAGICGAALSGAGPSILALCRRGPNAAKIGRAMQTAFLKHGVKSRCLTLGVDSHGANAQ